MKTESTVAHRLENILLLGALSLSPFYFWQSGLPQISHLLAVCAVGWRLLLRPRLYWVRGWGAGAAFLVYSTVVAVIVYARYSDLDTITGPLYYSFNFAVFVLVVTICTEAGRAFLTPVFWTYACLLICISVVSAAGIGRSFGSTRAMAMFNDPNQMANWILCCVCVLASVGKTLYGSWLPGLVAGGVASVGVVLSASRSGSLGLAALSVVLILAGSDRLVRSVRSGKRLTRVRRMVAAAGLLSLVCPVVIVVAASPTALERITSEVNGFGDRVAYLASRFLEIGHGEGWASLSGRGYDRLWAFPQYLILGAGEGATERFAARVWFLGEIHSSWAGLVFCYGAVGAALFGTFIVFSVARIRDCWHRLLLMGPFVYGFATYNLRNWCLWLALAIMIGGCSVIDNERSRSQSAR